MSAYELIICDGCGQRRAWPKGLGASNWKILREVLLKPYGWHARYAKGEPVRDICPECWTKGRR